MLPKLTMLQMLLDHPKEPNFFVDGYLPEHRDCYLCDAAESIQYFEEIATQYFYDFRELQGITELLYLAVTVVPEELEKTLEIAKKFLWAKEKWTRGTEDGTHAG